MTSRYTYRVRWSTEDEELVGTVVEFPSLSWLAADPDDAFDGIRTPVADVVREMREADEQAPRPHHRPSQCCGLPSPAPR